VFIFLPRFLITIIIIILLTSWQQTSRSHACGTLFLNTWDKSSCPKPEVFLCSTSCVGFSHLHYFDIMREKCIYVPSQVTHQEEEGATRQDVWLSDDGDHRNLPTVTLNLTTCLFMTWWKTWFILRGGHTGFNKTMIGGRNCLDDASFFVVSRDISGPWWRRIMQWIVHLRRMQTINMWGKIMN